MSGGWERILIALTGTRHYRCFVCGWKFRAPDFHRAMGQGVRNTNSAHASR